MTAHHRRRALAALAAALLACAAAAPAARAAQVTLGITGSTQMYTLGELLAKQFTGDRTDITMNVNPSSSQAGFDQTCTNVTVAGMSDVYIQDYQFRETPLCRDMINIPVAISAVAVTYNLPGKNLNARTSDGFTLVHPLRLTPQVLADIYMCKVTRWNAPEIAALNPSLSLPSNPIQAFNSSEPGGSGYVFSQWLARTVPAWKTKVGELGLQPPWPSGCSIGQASSGAMVQAIQNTPYSLGFAGFDYAISNGLQAAALRNASGVFNTPSLNGLSVAISNALYHREGPGITRDFRTSFVNIKGANAYNPACFEFYVVHRNLQGQGQALGSTIKGFLTWAIQDNGGQRYIEQIEFRKTGNATKAELAHGFIPVPQELRNAIRNTVNSIQT